MIAQEEALWKQITKSRKISSIDPAWLARNYCANLSKELRFIIAERLGWLGSQGWEFIKVLIEKQGIQEELIYAAGLCYQTEAKEWLYEQLRVRPNYKLEILRSLACWGGDIPIELLQEILSEKSQAIRLAGLDLLNFKAHQLDDKSILKVLEEPLKDFRDPVLLKTIHILQKRNGEKVCREITKLIMHGSKEVSKAGLIALGSIANSNSQKALLKLIQKLGSGPQKDLAKKQLKHQYNYKKQILFNQFL